LHFILRGEQYLHLLLVQLKNKRVSMAGAPAQVQGKKQPTISVL